MAHFAELDENNIVTRVVVVGNDIATAAGPLGENDMHVDGETWCVNFFNGGTWKQTSYNNNFRKQYAGKGYTFDAAKDKFISPQPFASWALDGNDDWQAPVTYPTVTEYGDPAKKYFISWDEDNQRWIATDQEDPENNFNWDASALAWVSA
jgi:hypothetical protein